MINNIEDRKAQIGLATAVWPIDDGVLDYPVSNCIRIELIIFRCCKIKLNSLLETSEVSYDVTPVK